MSETWTGAYVLHVYFDRPVQIEIGRMNGGSPVSIEPGDYLYAGSAMGRGGGLHLPHRLVRHLTRSGELPAHICLDRLLKHFAEHGVRPDKLRRKSPKRLFWNIDYILECLAAEVQHILYVRSERRLESTFVERIESWDDVSVPVRGFGAHDHRGHTHFLAMNPSNWDKCSRQLIELAAATESISRTRA